MNLFKMTPYYYKTGIEDQKKISDQIEKDKINLKDLEDKMTVVKADYTKAENEYKKLESLTAEETKLGEEYKKFESISSAIKEMNANKNLSVKYEKDICTFTEELDKKKDELESLNKELASLEDVNRLPPKEVLVFLTGFGAKLNSKIALLASKNNDEKIVFLTEKDTFIFANHITPENEISTTDALDELYHNDCKIIRIKKDFVRMHACEEDIKQIVSLIRPRYFVPISGSFKELLAAAKLAVSMNVGLNHNSIFVVDNGNIIEFEAGFGKISSNKVISGDLLIDGKGVGDIQNEVIEERQKFSDDGVIILAATISKSKHVICAGPDVQSRGLVFLKDNESLMKEITRLFVSTIEMELAKERYSISYIEEATKDIIFKAIRRSLNKTPIIIPILAEIE